MAIWETSREHPRKRASRICAREHLREAFSPGCLSKSTVGGGPEGAASLTRARRWAVSEMIALRASARLNVGATRAAERRLHVASVWNQPCIQGASARAFPAEHWQRSLPPSTPAAVNRPSIRRKCCGVSCRCGGFLLLFSAESAVIMRYIYQQPDWPEFRWDASVIGGQLAGARHRQGRLLGRMQAIGFELRGEAAMVYRLPRPRYHPGRVNPVRCFVQKPVLGRCEPIAC